MHLAKLYFYRSAAAKSQLSGRNISLEGRSPFKPPFSDSYLCRRFASFRLWSFVIGLRPLAPTGVAAKHLEQPGLLLDALQRRGDLRVDPVAVDIHQKDVLAKHGLGWA